MKRRLTIAFTLSLLVLLAVTGAVLAQGGISLSSLPGSGWYVSWQVQNVHPTETAHLVVQALSAMGENEASGSVQVDVAPGANETFIPGNLNALSPELPEGFIGSAVVSSDQPVVAIGFVQNNPVFDLGAQGGLAGAAYQGVSGDDAGTVVNYPLVKNNWVNQSTTFYVQAAGEPGARVTMTYRMNDGSVVEDGPYDLAPDQMKVFTPSDKLGNPACGSDPDTTPCLGGATVGSETGKIVGVFTDHPVSEDPASFVSATRGFGPGDADTTLYAPIIKYNWNGRTTGLSVQNASSSSVTVNVEFKGSPPAACAGSTYSGETATLDPGESTVYYPAAPVANMGGFPSSCFGSATVTASGNVVAVVNETGNNKKTVYSAFAASNATRKAALPLYKEDWKDRTSGPAIQNAGGAATNVTACYVISGSDIGQAKGTQVCLESQSIPAGGSISLYRVWTNTQKYGTQAANLQKSFGAVTVESDSENIVVVVPEQDLLGRYDIKNYEGFNID